ncbi:MAG: O-antigen ligase family protein [Selenomonadaceae bacterium]|nr:O-antigen ligase family protein [Selenomonadaceae bacterium]
MELANENIQADEKRRRLCLMAVYAEAFFIALSPWVAAAALIAGVLLWIYRTVKNPDRRFVRTKVDKFILAFFILSGLSVTGAMDPYFSFYNWYNLVGAYLLTYELVIQTVKNREEVIRLIYILGISAGLVILYGYYQFVFGINISDVAWVDANIYPELRKRVFSTWVNPNILAGYLNEVICVLVVFLSGAKTRKNKILLGSFIAAAALCLAMTYARGAIFSLGLILIVYGTLKDRRILYLALVGGAVALILSPSLLERLTTIFTKIDTSSEMRLAIWEATVWMIIEQPFLGIGWGMYWMVYRYYDFYINDPNVTIYHAHNMFLNFPAEIGIAGAAAFFYVFFKAMGTGFKEGKERNQEIVSNFSNGLALALVSVALGGLTDDVVFNIPTSMLLWFTIALIMKNNELGALQK